MIACQNRPFKLAALSVKMQARQMCTAKGSVPESYLFISLKSQFNTWLSPSIFAMSLKPLSQATGGRRSRKSEMNIFR